MDFKKKAKTCLRREAEGAENDDFYISIHTEKYIERALRAAYKRGWRDCDLDYTARSLGLREGKKARKK